MNRNRSLGWLLGLTALLAAVPAARAEDKPEVEPKAAGFVPSKLKQIDALLDEAVEKRQIAGGVALLIRKGQLGYLHAAGKRDAEAGTAMTPDTIFRIASMTKPITSVAILMLVDEGKLRLDDPLSKHLPEFKGLKVIAPRKEGDRDAPAPVPAEREVTIHDLLTHTSGIPYRFLAPPGLVDLYRKAGVHDGISSSELTLEENVKRIAKLPLAHQPGKAWTYGLNTDVLGRVVEVVSGQKLDDFFREQIFKPLKMNDTGFVVPADKKERLAALYKPGPDGKIARVGEEPVQMNQLIYSAGYPCDPRNAYRSGGGGLVSTPADYARFLRMLLGGGELDGVRLLKPATVKLMTSNQIGDLANAFGVHGARFGYGLGLVTGEGKMKGPASPGSFSWGGIFYTFFWVDPKQEMVGVLMTQLFPNSHLSLQVDFQEKAYKALAE
jgi:CubicO group peptidase (beta-lactamase class C family)